MININKNINKIVKKFINLPILEKILFILFILLSICVIYNFFNKKLEGFEDIKKITLKQDIDIYDDFYASIYDVFNYNKIKNQFEIGSIINTTAPTDKSIILDIGTRTGHRVNQLNNITNNIIGIDESSSMIKKAKENYPSLNFINENILNNMLFENNKFTHIICLNYIVYHIKNKKLFFENCYNWLLPGGCLAIHLVNKNKLNPIENIVNIKKNTLPNFVDPNLILTETIKFKDFNYKPKYYNVNNNISIFEETFKYNDGSIRKNEQKFYIDNKKDIIKIAKYIGFIILKIYDMKNYNYLYILQKPN